MLMREMRSETPSWWRVPCLGIQGFGSRVKFFAEKGEWGRDYGCHARPFVVCCTWLMVHGLGLRV